ncbi:hypothetical protein GC173_10170 [bacterium]|nr:hypothetical protein [bacterium]
MNRVTAHLLIGDGKSGKGVAPLWQLFLQEGDKTTWTLHKIGDPSFKPVTWAVSDQDRALEDGFILISYYVYTVGGIHQQIESNISDPKAPFVDLSTAAHKVDLEVLCDLIRKLTDHRLLLTVYEGSAAMDQLEILDWYHFNIEVCLPVYTRTHDAATKSLSDRGELAVPDLE